MTKDIETILETDSILTDMLTDPMFFIFFPIAHFLKTILASPQVAHLALHHPQADPSQSQKSHFFAYAPTEIRILVNYILTIKD